MVARWVKENNIFLSSVKGKARTGLAIQKGLFLFSREHRTELMDSRHTGFPSNQPLARCWMPTDDTVSTLCYEDIRS